MGEEKNYANQKQKMKKKENIDRIIRNIWTLYEMEKEKRKKIVG